MELAMISSARIPWILKSPLGTPRMGGMSGDERSPKPTWRGPRHAGEPRRPRTRTSERGEKGEARGAGARASVGWGEDPNTCGDPSILVLELSLPRGGRRL